ncbi:MAG: type II toxin-antitoxin system Phd/YefM family antitoxin [Gammaproteobacteria bacterium]|nr:type II toxin-antitoxin system Phd/YefM family antitoxin [Gammaproteobacteria bacterium]
MRVVNFSEARQRLKSVLDQVSSDTDFTVVTRRDAEDVVVMSMAMFNRMVESLGFPEADSDTPG